MLRRRFLNFGFTLVLVLAPVSWTVFSASTTSPARANRPLFRFVVTRIESVAASLQATRTLKPRKNAFRP